MQDKEYKPKEAPPGTAKTLTSAAIQNAHASGDGAMERSDTTTGGKGIKKPEKPVDDKGIPY